MGMTYMEAQASILKIGVALVLFALILITALLFFTYVLMLVEGITIIGGGIARAYAKMRTRLTPRLAGRLQKINTEKVWRTLCIFVAAATFILFIIASVFLLLG